MEQHMPYNIQYTKQKKQKKTKKPIDIEYRPNHIWVGVLMVNVQCRFVEFDTE